MTLDDTTRAAAEADVRAAEESRRQAMLDGNTARLGELMADSLLYVHATGVQDSKQRYLQQLLGGALRYEALAFVAPTFTVLGAVVLVHAVIKATILRGETRRNVASSYLAVWANSPSGWQLQALQATALPVTT